MKSFCFWTTALFIVLGIAGIYGQFTMSFPTPPSQLTANENLAFSLMCIAIGLWGLGSIAVSILKGEW